MTRSLEASPEFLAVRYLKLVRFSHTVFALPFAMTSAILAWNVPSAGSALGILDGPPAFSWRVLIGIIVCMVTARSAAMAFNRWTDRTYDAGNPRTRQRHLVTGELSIPQVIAFTLVTAGAFIASTALFLPNPWPLRFSVPVLAFVLAYSFTKRFTALSHLWLGLSLLLAPVCAWVAIRGEFLSAHPNDVFPAALLGLAVLLWVTGFDIIYACQDVDFDRAQGLRSIPAAIGIPRALRCAALAHAGMIGVLALLPMIVPQLPLGSIYYAGVLAAAGLLIYEHLLVHPSDLTRVNLAFFNVNALISIGLMAVVAFDVWWT